MKKDHYMKLKFIAITLAVSALAACSPSKKEKVTDDGSISARTPETENLLAHLKKGKAMKGVLM